MNLRSFRTRASAVRCAIDVAVPYFMTKPGSAVLSPSTSQQVFLVPVREVVNATRWSFRESWVIYNWPLEAL